MKFGFSSCRAEPFSEQAIKEEADRYVMSHFGCGRKHKKAYIEGAMYVLSLMKGKVPYGTSKEKNRREETRPNCC